MSDSLRDGNGVSAGYMAEKSISGADNTVMGRVYNSANTRFLCGKTCVQISWIEVTMDDIGPFPLYEGTEVQEGFLVEKILTIGPGMDHFNTLYPNIEF
jgi:hypothetical protein